MSDQDHNVLSEDPNAGLATPIMDLLAAGAIAVVAVWIAVESLRLPVSGDLITAPGLLPFLTAGSLLVMCGLLAATALRRRKTIVPGADRIELPADFRRSMILGGILIVYIGGLQYLPIETAIVLGSVRLVIGSFEVVSIIILTLIMRIYWGQALWLCLTIAVGWIVFLSLVFRLVFKMQLP